jgi:hypothetical protein
MSPLPRPILLTKLTVSLANFWARKDLANFLLEALDFLVVGFAYSVNNMLSYLNITNLPILYYTIHMYVIVMSTLASGTHTVIHFL